MQSAADAIIENSFFISVVIICRENKTKYKDIQKVVSLQPQVGKKEKPAPGFPVTGFSFVVRLSFR